MEYKIIEGHKEDFEKQLNELNQEGRLIMKDYKMVVIDNKPFYSTLVCM